MKRFSTFLLCLTFTLGSKAQIAKWLIPPSYDKIQMSKGISGLTTDSMGVKTIWTLEGKRLISTAVPLYPFVEGLALSVNPDSAAIDAIYRSNGESFSLKGCKMTHNYPYYSSGKLLVKKGEYYRYADANGIIENNDYVEAYPYFKGYATCDIYLNFEKQKDLRHLLIDLKGSPVVFKVKNKPVDQEDVQYISSLNDEGIGVVIIKQKLFLFDSKNQSLSPLFIDEQMPDNSKNQASLVGDVSQCYSLKADSTFVITAKCGKVDMVLITLDRLRRPVSIKRNDTQHTYMMEQEEKKSYKSMLTVKQEGNHLGLWCEGTEMLPAQFEEVVACYDDKALVKIKGKYGMLKIFKDMHFSVKMNRGDDIAFRHQKFDTTLRVDFPSVIPANQVSIDINPLSGCLIDRTSKEWKTTESGGYVQYNCVLIIPEDLPDKLTSLDYPYRIKYDNLISSQMPFSVNAWHYKYFVVDVDDTQTTLDKGTVSFVFNINAERIASDRVYPTTVKIVTDSLQFEYEKMSEIRYKCKVLSLREGVNNILIQVLEQGCPPANFPFEVEYHKPVAKTRNKPAEEEKVIIKKKDSSSAPHVFM